MDTGNGLFQMLQEENEKLAAIKKAEMERQHPNHGGWFHEGELIEIKGSIFKVTRITPTKLTLKLQKRG